MHQDLVNTESSQVDVVAVDLHLDREICDNLCKSRDYEHSTNDIYPQNTCVPEWAYQNGHPLAVMDAFAEQ